MLTRLFAITILVLASSFQQPAAANPVISSVSPRTAPIFGQTFTIAGSGFTSQTITYVQIGTLPVATSFSVNSDTQIVATFAAVRANYNNLNAVVAWGTSAFTQLTNAVTYAQPVITSVLCSGDNYMPSDTASTITITGSHFGTATSAFTYVQIGAYPISPSFSVVDDSHITALFHGTGFDTAMQNVFVAWDDINGNPGPYAEKTSCICWCCTGDPACGGVMTCYNSPCFA